MDTSAIEGLASFSLGSFPSELLIVVGVWFLLSILGFALGVSKLEAIGLSGITTAFIAPHIHTAWLISSLLGNTTEPTKAETILITGVIAVVLFFIFMRLCDPGLADGGEAISSTVSGLAVIVILLVLWAMQFSALWPFPALLSSVFAPPFFFWWLLGALVLLVVMRQKRLWK